MGLVGLVGNLLRSNNMAENDTVVVVNILGIDGPMNGTRRVYYNLQGGPSASLTVETNATTTPATLVDSINSALTAVAIEEFPGTPASQVGIQGWATNNPQVLANTAQRRGGGLS